MIASLRRIWIVGRRELAGYFDQATAYILLVIFLVTNNFFFFRGVFLIGEASLRPMLDLLPWLLLFFAPAVSMRALAEERNQGTLELVLSQPIEVFEFVLGKFLGAFLFLMVAMGGTLALPLGLSASADLQVGVIVAQYVGAAFLAAGLAAAGLWASSMTKNQVTAFILGVSASFALYLLGMPTVALGLPPTLAEIASNLGILGHVASVSRGVIDLRDVLYFAAVSATFLVLTYSSLMSARLSRAKPGYRRLRLGVVGLVGIAVFAALAGGQLRGRIDLTPGGLYTLSRPAKDLVQGLDDLVTIRVFRSGDLPPQLTTVGRDVDDLLRDFQAAGENLQVISVDPADDPDTESEAGMLGIRPVQFNVYGEDELTVRSGYFGLAVQYAGESEVIPVVTRTSDLEYRLASMIRSLTVTERLTVGVMQGPGDMQLGTEMAIVANRLGREYNVVPFAPDTAVQVVPDTFDVLFSLAGFRQPMPLGPAEADLIGDFLDRGGNVMLMRSSAQVDQQTMFGGSVADVALDSLLLSRGLGVVPSLAFDLQSNERVAIGRGGLGAVAVGYPLWPLGQPLGEHVVTEGVASVPMRWSSPLLIETDSALVTPFLGTTDAGGRLQLPASADALQDWETLATPEDLVAEALVIGYSDPGGGRLVLGGSSAFISDEVVQTSITGGAGVLFFQNLVDWLMQDEDLISIRSKERAPPRMVWSSDGARNAVRYANLVGVPLLFVVFGVWRVARRRRLERTPWRAGGWVR